MKLFIWHPVGGRGCTISVPAYAGRPKTLQAVPGLDGRPSREVKAFKETEDEFLARIIRKVVPQGVEHWIIEDDDPRLLAAQADRSQRHAWMFSEPDGFRIDPNLL